MECFAHAFQTQKVMYVQMQSVCVCTYVTLCTRTLRSPITKCCARHFFLGHPSSHLSSFWFSPSAKKPKVVYAFVTATSYRQMTTLFSLNRPLSLFRLPSLSVYYGTHALFLRPIHARAKTGIPLFMNGCMYLMGMRVVANAKMDKARHEAMLGNAFVVAFVLPFNKYYYIYIYILLDTQSDTHKYLYSFVYAGVVVCQSAWDHASLLSSRRQSSN